MKGIEHYRHAERLLSEMDRPMYRDSSMPLRTDEQRTMLAAAAQAHATLALASVTALVESSRSASGAAMRPAIDHINEWVESE